MSLFQPLILILLLLFTGPLAKMSTVFVNSSEDRGSILGRVIPKTQKMVRDAALLSIQHYKVMIKGKVEQSWEWSSSLPTPWCSSY